MLDSFGKNPSGVELFDSYGKKSNSRMLMSYGFIENFPESSEFLFNLNFSKETVEMYAEKLKLQPQLSTNPALKLVCCSEYDEETFIKGMRFWVASTAGELQQLAVRTCK